MNKSEFFKTLKKELSLLSKSEQQDILSDYEEYFNEAERSGKSEVEAVAELGDPEQIIKELKAYNLVKSAGDKLTIQNAIRIMFSFLNLGVINIFFVFPYLFIVFTLIGVSFTSLGMIFFGLFGTLGEIGQVIFNHLIVPNNFGQRLGISLLTLVCGIGLAIADYFFIKYFYKFTVRYIKMNIQFLKEDSE